MEVNIHLELVLISLRGGSVHRAPFQYKRVSFKVWSLLKTHIVPFELLNHDHVVIVPSYPRFTFRYCGLRIVARWPGLLIKAVSAVRKG